MVRNHTDMIGPNMAPTRPVPKRCIVNSRNNTTSDKATMTFSETGVATLRPSMALSTEIAGVIIPSPYNSAAPNNPRTMSTVRRCGIARPPLLLEDQRHQRENPTFTAVVGAHDEDDVLHRDDEHEQPDDERENPVDVLG